MKLFTGLLCKFTGSDLYSHRASPLPHNVRRGEVVLESKNSNMLRGAHVFRIEILMQLRALKKTRKDVSLNSPIGTDKEGNEITIGDVLGSDNDDTEEEVSKRLEIKSMMKLMDILDERERRVIELRFGLTDGEEWTQNEVAEALGISRSYVSRLEKRALLKMFHQSYAGQRKRKPFVYKPKAPVQE